jgi:hypothetical protein
MGLGWYLAKVKLGESVNVRSLMKCWSAAGLSDSLFHGVFVLPKTKKGIFTIKDHDEFALIESRYGVADNVDRISASLTGDSHNVGVSGAMVIYRSLDHRHPEVALLSANGEPSRTKSMKPYALLIENMENFLALDVISKFISAYTNLSMETLGHCEFIYSQGRAIQKSITLDYLSRFEHTYWLPDLDAAGLDIYLGAQRVLGESSTTLLYPHDLADRLSWSGKPINTDTRNTLKTLSGASTELNHVCTLLIEAEKTLEEEAYLAKH